MNGLDMLVCLVARRMRNPVGVGVRRGGLHAIRHVGLYFSFDLSRYFNSFSSVSESLV